MRFQNSARSPFTPDIVDLEKEGRECFIVDLACPFDTQPGSRKRRGEDRPLSRLESAKDL